MLRILTTVTYLFLLLCAEGEYLRVVLLCAQNHRCASVRACECLGSLRDRVLSSVMMRYNVGNGMPMAWLTCFQCSSEGKCKSFSIKLHENIPSVHKGDAHTHTHTLHFIASIYSIFVFVFISLFMLSPLPSFLHSLVVRAQLAVGLRRCGDNGIGPGAHTELFICGVGWVI